jgi:DtxR family Mn-dependent transcriptional regulator
LSKTLTLSIQDYLKAIYDLTASGEAASTTALAARLGISPASVTGMVQKLASLRPPLVLYRKHHGVLLTAAGRRGALAVIRHHRLLETWLVQSLGYSWDRVHSEAENLEHAISDEMEQRISTALGNPERDPHGDPIPSRTLRMPADHSVPLTELAAGQHATVSRVRVDSPELLRRLEKEGLKPGASIKRMQMSRAERRMRLQVLDRKRSSHIDRETAARVFVEISRSKG